MVSEVCVRTHLVDNLMFVPCIIRRSRNNQRYAQICITALFYMLAPTCFGSRLPSSGRSWIRLSYMKIQIDLVVHHIMLVKWPVWRSVVVTGCTNNLNILTIVRSAHTGFVVFVWEQTATCATYTKNWLVFITENKSVYSAVRTGYLNKATCAPSFKG
jgi:hypothetical protein